MFTGLTDLTLSHYKPYVTPHPRPVPPESQLGDHPLESCLSLPVGVPNPLPAYGSRADHPFSPDPQRVPTLAE